VKFKPKTKLRIIVLVHQDLIPPDNLEGIHRSGKPAVAHGKRRDHHVENMGHHAYCVGLYSDLGAVGKAIEEFKPHIAVNLLEEFDGKVLFDQNVVSYLELMKQPYTGCNPRGLTLARDKALTKKILTYHRIPVPGLPCFPVARKLSGQASGLPPVCEISD
jgi:hypothetical protein